MNKILPIILVVVLSGCAVTPSVTILEEFNPDTKTIVLLSSGPWDKELRINLAKKGFKILKFASVNTITNKQGSKEIQHNEAESSYGIEFNFRTVDRCSFSKGWKIDGVIEVVDLRTNQVVMYVERGGWTSPCVVTADGLVFEQIADDLAKNWK
tara:strand:- start:63 stop:524 length:462 start_codon:yes stop_codon:yes gene_type:complete